MNYLLYGTESFLIEQELKKIKLHPNPSSGTINITHPLFEEKTTLRIYDNLGKEIFNQELKENTLSANLKKVLTLRFFEAYLSNDYLSGEVSPWFSDEKFLEQEYKNCLKTDLCEEWVKLIKTIWSRMQKRIEVGRKVTAVDARYLKIAQD